MATVTYIPEKKQTLGAMKGVMDYVRQEKKTRDPVTGQRFVTGVHCLGDNAFQEFLATKRTYGKTKGMNFYQYVQSFSPKETVTLEKAHAIALEFAQKAWPGFEVLVATHRDAGHLHSHFVVNSVSWETGRKLRQSPKTLQTLRALSDEICAAQGLSVLPRYEKPGAKLSSREYRAAQKGESWKFRLMGAITQAMERSGTRRDFLRAMERRGYQVAWEDNRKYITYTTPGGRKCRDIRLHQEKFRKEYMEYEFKIRAELLRQLVGGLSGEEHPDPHRDGAEALRPHSVRYPGHQLGGYAGAFEGRQHLPAHPVPEAESPGHLGGGAGAGVPAGGSAGGGPGPGDEESPVRTDPEQPAGPVPNPGGAGEGASQPGEFPTTGWEAARGIYLQAVKRVLRLAGEAGGISAGNRKAVAVAPAAEHPGAGALLGLGLRGVVDAAAVIESEEEDEEQRRERILAEANGQDLGAALGIVLGLASALLEEPGPLPEEEEGPDYTMQL